MKTKHEKFNYTARVAYICPCCDMEIGDNKPDYCPNCEVRMLYPAEQLEPEGEMYVNCAADEADGRVNLYDGDHILFVKKVPPPQQPSEGEMFKILAGKCISDDSAKQAVRDITELLNHKR